LNRKKSRNEGRVYIVRVREGGLRVMKERVIRERVR